MKIYIAAPLSEAHAYECLARPLEECGHTVVSSWHRRVTVFGLSADPNDDAERARILEQNLVDLSTADIVIAFVPLGVPRSTYAEVGWALANRKRVLWCHGPNGEGRCLFDAHPLVTRVTSSDGLYAVGNGLVRRCA